MHELTIEIMQFNYRWHLRYATQELVPYHVIDPQPGARERVLRLLEMTEEELLSDCCVEYFQRLATWLIPRLPYYPWARHYRFSLVVQQPSRKPLQEDTKDTSVTALSFEKEVKLAGRSCYFVSC
jgi:hypothetical protein